MKNNQNTNPKMDWCSFFHNCPDTPASVFYSLMVEKWRDWTNMSLHSFTLTDLTNLSSFPTIRGSVVIQ